MYAPWVNNFVLFRSYVDTHLGQKPSKAHSIDRADNEKGYAPGNLRWATKAEQAQNRRTTKLDNTDVLFVRHWASRGFPQKRIAEAFGVKPSYVSQVAHEHRRTAV